MGKSSPHGQFNPACDDDLCHPTCYAGGAISSDRGMVYHNGEKRSDKTVSYTVAASHAGPLGGSNSKLSGAAI